MGASCDGAVVTNMSYNFEQCFWDPFDDGVNVLLEHISSGIKSCDTMVHFFKQRSELEKDYARRLGAISNKLNKDIEEKPEFGSLYKTYNTILNHEKSRAQAHSKQSEVINRQVYSDIKLFAQNLQAKYVTISSKIEKLRLDKYNKKKGCEELSKRLEEAQTFARDLQLNQNNIIGSRKIEQNRKELAKWESNSQEFALQLDVLKQESRAAQKFWFKEWGNVTHELQEMESARISFLQSKIQQYAEATTETSLLEQARMDTLTNQLATFTAADDIRDFSNNFGTGRLREKTQPNASSSVTGNIKERNISSQSHKRDSYVENIRKLSAQLQRQGQKSYSRSVHDKNSNGYAYQEQENNFEHRSQLQPRPEPEPESLLDCSYKATRREIRVIESPRSERTSPDEVTRYSPPELRVESPKEHKNAYSSSSASSSQPTDFTHIKNRTSFDSMATSVSSMASSIDDSRRFAKSWNSSNRKRKSLSSIQRQQYEEQQQQRHLSPSPNSTEHTSRVDENTKMRDSSASTTIVSRPNGEDYHIRRKSMILKDSKSPIEDALYEMERIRSIGSGDIFASSENAVGRVRDNGVTVTLPLVTSDGETVIKYAKAIYPLANNDAPEVAHFQKGDYLLITSIVNEDWFRGEVYENNGIDRNHAIGLIPFNFIKVLS